MYELIKLCLLINIPLTLCLTGYFGHFITTTCVAQTLLIFWNIFGSLVIVGSQMRIANFYFGLLRHQSCGIFLLVSCAVNTPLNVIAFGGLWCDLSKNNRTVVLNVKNTQIFYGRDKSMKEISDNDKH